MPLLIDSAPDCIVHKEHYSADDIADFVLQDNFKDCAGFGTFMPGSTYGDDGSGAETYLGAMAENTEALVDGMSGGEITCRPEV